MSKPESTARHRSFQSPAAGCHPGDPHHRARAPPAPRLRLNAAASAMALLHGRPCGLQQRPGLTPAARGASSAIFTARSGRPAPRCRTCVVRAADEPDSREEAGSVGTKDWRSELWTPSHRPCHATITSSSCVMIAENPVVLLVKVCAHAWWPVRQKASATPAVCKMVAGRIRCPAQRRAAC